MSGLIISVTASGRVGRDRITYRNTAGRNDLICVSGDLGAAYAGLQLLERERKIFESDPGVQPELSAYPYVLQRQLKPEARKDIMEELERQSILPTSMIDVSDGLSSDLLHLCKQSERGCRIFQDKIPINRETAELAGEFNIEPFICALNGGEDYELLFTVPVPDFERVRSINDVSVIGHMTDPEDGCKFITNEGAEIVLTAQGWDGLK
jgi:thiamine-monophosphate kinase